MAAVKRRRGVMAHGMVGGGSGCYGGGGRGVGSGRRCRAVGGSGAFNAGADLRGTAGSVRKADSIRPPCGHLSYSFGPPART